MGETEHSLYIPPVTVAAAAAPAQRALKYINSIAPALWSHFGITVRVYQIRPKDIVNPRVRAAFRRRDIDRLPALLAEGRAYIGCREIENYYSHRLQPDEEDSPVVTLGYDNSFEYSAADDGFADGALDEYFRGEMRVAQRRSAPQRGSPQRGSPQRGAHYDEEIDASKFGYLGDDD